MLNMHFKLNVLKLPVTTFLFFQEGYQDLNTFENDEVQCLILPVSFDLNARI